MKLSYSTIPAFLCVQLLVFGVRAQTPLGATDATVAPQQQSANRDAQEADASSSPIEAAPATTAAAPTKPTPAMPAPSAPALAPDWRREIARAAEPQTRWYGWQNLAGDALSIGLIAQGASSNSALAYVGLVGYVVASPVIHGAHGNGGKSVLSASLRLGLPLLGGLWAAALISPPQNTENGDIARTLQIAAGALVGAIVAIAIDDFGVARQTVTTPQTSASVLKTVRVVPIVSKDVRGISLALSL